MREAGVPAEIATEYFPNSSLERSSYASPIGNSNHENNSMIEEAKIPKLKPEIMKF
jgi:hypothetical protein